MISLALAALLYKCAVSLLIFALVGGSLYYCIRRDEDWPFSCLAMFSYQPSRELYQFGFFAGFGTEERQLVTQDVGLSGDQFRRMFFIRYYGSTSARHPWGQRKSDSLPEFTARLTEFCRALTEVMKRRGRGEPEYIRIEIVGVVAEPNPVPFERKKIGTYFANKGIFELGGASAVAKSGSAA
ncbi:MAG: hypothetical protein HY078_14190 [Elusimicrobia bacterium]|nr:hypothetical protein [Elusimicrobiota bacterium]